MSTRAKVLPIYAAGVLSVALWHVTIIYAACSVVCAVITWWASERSEQPSEGIGDMPDPRALQGKPGYVPTIVIMLIARDRFCDERIYSVMREFRFRRYQYAPLDDACNVENACRVLVKRQMRVEPGLRDYIARLTENAKWPLARTLRVDCGECALTGGNASFKVGAAKA